MKKKSTILTVVFVSIIIAVWGLRVPQMIMNPSEMLRKELNSKETYYSTKRVEFLMWLGADPAAHTLTGGMDQYNPYNFILINAIRNKRVKVIPLLAADYTEEQKRIALTLAEDNQEIKEALIDLFNNKGEE